MSERVVSARNYVAKELTKLKNKLKLAAYVNGGDMDWVRPMATNLIIATPACLSVCLQSKLFRRYDSDGYEGYEGYEGYSIQTATAPRRRVALLALTLTLTLTLTLALASGNGTLCLREFYSAVRHNGQIGTSEL